MRIATITAFIVFVLASASPAGVQFYAGTYDHALQAAATDHKLLLIDFMTDWCRWCDTLDARTYSDRGVTNYVDRYFVPFKIDAEKGDGIALAKKHGVRAFPTILVVSPDGEEIDRIVGYTPPDKFLQSLADFREGKNTLVSVKALLRDKPNDPETHYIAAQKYLSRFDGASAEEHFRRVLELDPNNTLGHADEARFQTALLHLQTAGKPDQLIAYAGATPSPKQATEALRVLSRYYLRQKDADSAMTWFGRFMEREPSDAQEMNNFAWECAELNAHLDYCAEISAKAVSLATNDEERAMFLDTQATVEFKRGNVEKALTLEEKAVGLIGGLPEKARKPYEESLAKFKSAKTTSTPH